MADLMAIVSKAVFEKAAGKAPAVGTRLRMDRYVSTNKNLDRLAEGGKLYLVTVRPPDEALWLVAILDNPEFDGERWVAAPCETPITDITALKSKLEFESGKGLSAAKGALGMSLQTPRAVTVEDARLLDEAAGVATPAAPASPGSGGRAGFPSAPDGVLATGSSNRRALLLEAVIADPTNLDARQVYADALSGANDPRGELIQVDSALAGPLSIRRREALATQRAALFAAHAKTWWPYRDVRLRVTRGFVESISGYVGKIDAAAEIFEREPVITVEVCGVRGVEAVERLLATRWLPRVRRLSVRGKIGDDGFKLLIASPALAGLDTLNVSGNRITADGVAALQGRLPACRTLVLSNNKLGDAAMAGLLAWKQLGQLEKLYLGNCGLTGDGVAQLLDGPPLTALVKLALTGNKLGRDFGGVFAAKAAKLPALRHLDLVKTGIGTAGARQVAEAKLPRITRLDLRSNRIDAALAAGDPRISA